MNPGRRVLGPLLLALAALACASAPDPAPQARHILWRATPPPGLEGEVHLLGSVHLGAADLIPLPDVMEAAFDDAHRVVFELDLDALLGAVFSTFRHGFYWDGRTLESELSPMAWELVQENDGGLGVADSFLLRRAKPWLLAMMLTTEEIAADRREADGDDSIDQYLSRRATAEGKERLFFETAGQQLGFFDRITAEEQERFLLESLGFDENGEELADADDLEALVAAWKRGDAEDMGRLVGESFGSGSSLSEVLLHERNRNWADRLPGMVRPDSPLLVVVGAGHLVGDGSLVELLRARGWTVTQL
jgi:uncharacterized protein